MDAKEFRGRKHCSETRHLQIERNVFMQARGITKIYFLKLSRIV